jgi:cytochrome c oxidase subunit 2
VILQAEVWYITLAGMGLISLAFVYAIAGARSPAPDGAQVQKKAYAVRRWWFLALVVLGVGASWASLKAFPIADQQGTSASAQVVNAVGRQWSWELSQNRFTAGVPVEFRVTSADVNHGFAIYGPDERIVTQTQAMPGFTNRLVHTFSRPGKYRVLCLEYCGIAHHGMMAEFEIVAAEKGNRS